MLDGAVGRNYRLWGDMRKADQEEDRLDTTFPARYLADMCDSSTSIQAPSPTSSLPRLLVSVRNREEALIAHQSGADLIDLKEPLKGSLGMVDLDTAQSIAEELPSSTLSLALGELSDWRDRKTVPPIPTAYQYLKLGLANQVSRPEWKRDWQQFRQRIELQSNQSFDWIAVVYADHLAANSPSPEEIITAAIESGCRGVLFDTWSKESGSLVDHLTTAQLTNYSSLIHSAGLLSAFAGSLRREHLEALLPIAPSIIAVRGAVCENSNRVARLCRNQMNEFQQSLKTSLTHKP